MCSYIESSKLIQRKVESGKLGSKSGEGFYNWSSEALEKKQKERTEALIYFLERDVQNKQWK